MGSDSICPASCSGVCYRDEKLVGSTLFPAVGSWNLNDWKLEVEFDKNFSEVRSWKWNFLDRPCIPAFGENLEFSTFLWSYRLQ